MKKWKHIASDHSSSIYVHGGSYLNAAFTLDKNILGKNNHSIIFVMQNTEWKFCANVSEWEAMGRIALKKLENPAFLEKVYSGQKETCRKVIAYTEKIKSQNLKNISNSALANLYLGLFEPWDQMNMWGEIPNLADFEHFMLTNKIMAFLGLQVKKTKSEISAGEAFGILVTSTERSYLQQEELGLFTILAQIQSSKEAKKLFENDLQIIIQNIAKLPKIHSLLKKHTEKYDWMQFHYDGPIILQMDYFIDILRSEIKQGIDGSQKIKSILGNESALVKRQMELEKKLSLSENQKYWLKVARTFSYLKGIRKDTVFMGSRNSGPLINEIARRLGLSPKQVRHSTPLEISDALVNGKIDVNLINQRIALCVIIWDKNKIRITVGKEAKGLVARVYEDKADPNQKELIGMPAYPGLVSGIVKIVNKSSDMEKVQKGDILVSSATNPNLVPAMKKAGAIVTDEGGVTCHAAIVSRELKIPCVIGTKVATKLLRDGDKVEVDAINGIVRKLGS